MLQPFLFHLFYSLLFNSFLKTSERTKHQNVFIHSLWVCNYPDAVDQTNGSEVNEIANIDLLMKTIFKLFDLF